MQFYNFSLEIQKNSLPRDYLDDLLGIDYFYDCFGDVYYQKRNYEESLRYYNMSLEIKIKHLQPKHSEIAKSYNNIGNVYFQQGNYEEAFKFYNRSFEIYDKFEIKNHPYFAKTHMNFGNFYYKLGKYNKSLNFYHQSLEIYIKSLQSNDPIFDQLYHKIYMVYNRISYKYIFVFVDAIDSIINILIYLIRYFINFLSKTLFFIKS